MRNFKNLVICTAIVAGMLIFEAQAQEANKPMSGPGVLDIQEALSGGVITVAGHQNPAANGRTISVLWIRDRAGRLFACGAEANYTTGEDVSKLKVNCRRVGG